jgi:hypothetical protein
MKSNAINAFRASFAAVLFIVLLSGASATAQQKAGSIITGEPVIHYMGTSNELAAFKLQYQNNSGKSFVLTILDGEGEVLFDKVYTDSLFSKIIKAPAEIGRLTFIIRDNRYRNQKKIAVNMKSRFVEEMSVTRL